MIGKAYGLTLGRQAWQVEAGDENAAPLVARFAKVMRLHAIDCVDRPQFATDRVVVVTESDAGAKGGAVCVLNPVDGDSALFCHLLSLSLFIAHEAQRHDCVLLHGALAQRAGQGVILSAPSGTGKTTASNRLPPPWISLCDDTTLVRRDASGAFWAHPWPTWSRFLNPADGEGASWDVQSSVPLDRVYFLKRDPRDHAEPLGAAQAVGLLNDAARPISGAMENARVTSKSEARAERVRLFALLCVMAKIIPAHQLCLSPNGAFWEHM